MARSEEIQHSNLKNLLCQLNSFREVGQLWQDHFEEHREEYAAVAFVRPDVMYQSPFPVHLIPELKVRSGAQACSFCLRTLESQRPPCSRLSFNSLQSVAVEDMYTDSSFQSKHIHQSNCSCRKMRLMFHPSKVTASSMTASLFFCPNPPLCGRTDWTTLSNNVYCSPFTQKSLHNCSL